MENMRFEELQSLAQIGNSEAIIELAKFYYDAKNYSLAFQTISRFEFIEDAVGYRELGRYYEKGIGVDVDIEKAKSLYSASYELGDYVAGYLLAVNLSKGKQYFEAINYLSLGVFNNYIPSIKLLADFYLKGLGLEKNTKIAINLYTKLIELGENKYYDVIGKIYYQQKDYYKAIIYFKEGANLFDLDAIYHLAICYAKGEGVAMDNIKAVNYYEMGAKANHAKCIYNLALHYQKGIGVKMDMEKASELLAKYDELIKKSDK